MRLIDADAFRHRMYHEVFEKDGEDQRWDSGCWMRYRLFDRVLEEQPTVAQPERKTGKWMVDPDGRLHCSRCFENPTNRVMIDGRLVYDMTPIVGRMRYCPNCGAKMEVSE